MANELPFKLPVRVAETPLSGRELFQILGADGYVVADDMFRDEADAIVAALNGYAAMREALESMPRPSRMGGMSDFGIRILVWQAKVDAALNPPAAKEGA